MNHRLCKLGTLRMLRDDGKDLGRLIDIRVRTKLGRIARSESVPVDALLVGGAGWLARMGLRREGGLELPPNAIVAVESDRIVVRSPKLARPAARSKRKPR